MKHEKLIWSCGGLNSRLLACKASTLQLSYNPLLIVIRGSEKCHARQREYKGFADRLRDIILAETLKLRDPKI